MRVTFTLTQHTVDRIKTAAKTSGVNMSALVEQCINSALDSGVTVRIGGARNVQALHTDAYQGSTKATPERMDVAPEHTRSFTPFELTDEEKAEFGV